jgi:hypothetical protein
MPDKEKIPGIGVKMEAAFPYTSELYFLILSNQSNLIPSNP